MANPEGTPKNIDVNSLNRLPEKREQGWGVKKPEGQSIWGIDKPGEQEEAEEIDFPVRVFPSATWVGPFSRKSSERPKRD